jgi:hypothetical protein
MSHGDDYRAFIHLSRAWYAQANLAGQKYVDEVWFTDGSGAELLVRWYALGGGAPAPRLEVFDDSWAALARLSDVIVLLAEADGKNIPPDVFCRALVRAGFRDDTPIDDERKTSLEAKIRALVEVERLSHD